MTRVIVDETLRTRLNRFSEEVELCDESGQTLGLFLPVDLYQKLLTAADRCPYSAAELERRRQETGGRSLEEIWKRLGRT
jgi:hypothetical protein